MATAHLSLRTTESLLAMTDFPNMTLIRATDNCCLQDVISSSIIYLLNLYHPKRPYAGLQNVLVSGLAMLVSDLLGSNLNVYATLQKLRPSRDTSDI
jgi:hypothetical protein